MNLIFWHRVNFLLTWIKIQKHMYLNTRGILCWILSEGCFCSKAGSGEYFLFQIIPISLFTLIYVLIVLGRRKMMKRKEKREERREERHRQWKRGKENERTERAPAIAL